MADCAKCDHELGIGRYCTNCGHPVDNPVDNPVDSPADSPAYSPAAGAAPDDWRTGTAERPLAAPPPEQPSTVPSAPPPAPPPAWTPPPAARYPLFADEVEAPAEPVAPRTHRRSRPWGVWAAVAVALVVVAFLGIRLLDGGDDDNPAAEEPSPSAPATDEPDAQETPSDDEPSEAPSGLTSQAEVTVPKTAGPGQDAEGNPVDYEGDNMLDGVPETCWRMAGDGTGSEIVITLPEETQLRSVGLINGYAKQGGGQDWYHGNRRIRQVEWEFDNGSTVPQSLDDTTSVQSVDVDVATTTITLRLVQVSKPGTGPDRRNFTAISDLLLVAG